MKPLVLSLLLFSALALSACAPRYLVNSEGCKALADGYLLCDRDRIKEIR